MQTLRSCVIKSITECIQVGERTDFGLSALLEGLNLGCGKLLAGAPLALFSSNSAAAAMPAPKPPPALTSFDNVACWVDAACNR